MYRRAHTHTHTRRFGESLYVRLTVEGKGDFLYRITSSFSSSLGTDADTIKIYIRKRVSSTAQMGHYRQVKVKVVAKVQRKYF